MSVSPGVPPHSPVSPSHVPSALCPCGPRCPHHVAGSPCILMFPHPWSNSSLCPHILPLPCPFVPLCSYILLSPYSRVTHPHIPPCPNVPKCPHPPCCHVPIPAVSISLSPCPPSSSAHIPPAPIPTFPLSPCPPSPFLCVPLSPHPCVPCPGMRRRSTTAQRRRTSLSCSKRWGDPDTEGGP